MVGNLVMDNNKVTVSVIMGIYNTESTLAEAIDSIINQTFIDWELILCDDASSDRTYEIAKDYAKKYSNIKLIRNKKNMGLNYTLNHCLKYATGKYIARMDGDDLSEPYRFEKQVRFLEEHPDIAIVSSLMTCFDENGVWGQTTAVEYPTNLVFAKRTPFCHAPSMVRKEAFDAVKGYAVDKRLLRVEDYDLWIRMYAEGYKGANILEPLYRVRDDRNAKSRRKFKYRINEVYVRYLGFKRLKQPVSKFPYIFRPLLVGLMPSGLYNLLHKKQFKK